MPTIHNTGAPTFLPKLQKAITDGELDATELRKLRHDAMEALEKTPSMQRSAAAKAYVDAIEHNVPASVRMTPENKVYFENVKKALDLRGKAEEVVAALVKYLKSHDLPPELAMIKPDGVEAAGRTGGKGAAFAPVIKIETDEGVGGGYRAWPEMIRKLEALFKNAPELAAGKNFFQGYYIHSSMGASSFRPDGNYT